MISNAPIYKASYYKLTVYILIIFKEWWLIDNSLNLDIKNKNQIVFRGVSSLYLFVFFESLSKLVCQNMNCPNALVLYNSFNINYFI